MSYEPDNLGTWCPVLGLIFRLAPGLWGSGTEYGTLESWRERWLLGDLEDIKIYT